MKDFFIGVCASITATVICYMIKLAYIKIKNHSTGNRSGLN